MPTYVYQEVLEGGEPGLVFEVVQRMADPPLSEHPTTGNPVRRVLQPPMPIIGGYSPGKSTLSDGNLDRLGFTKYQKASDGRYEKTAGSGPDLINRGGGEE